MALARAEVGQHARSHVVDAGARTRAELMRAFDIVISLAALVVAGPILLVLALIICIESPAMPIYRQRRLGLDGQEFWMLKLRTMVPNADRLKAQLEHLNEAKPPLFKLHNDPRVTRVGRFLRATSLDELPQVLNVLHGDMSIVGPRPRLPSEFDLSVPEHRVRFSVKPGLAGLWQVSGRAQLDFDEALAVDLEYIRRKSFLFDLELIARTAWVVLRRDGAY